MRKILKDSFKSQANKLIYLVLGILVLLEIAGLIVNVTLYSQDKSNIIVLIMGIIIIVFIFFLIILVTRMMLGITKISFATTKIAEGDIAFADQLEEGTKALGGVSNSVSEIKMNLVAFSDAAKESVTVLGNSVDQLNKNMGCMEEGNKQIADSMIDISETTTSQSQIASDTLDGIRASCERIDKICIDVDNIHKQLEKNLDETNQGKNTIQAYSAESSKISDSLQSTQTDMNELKEHLQGIEEIEAFVVNISDELKMLGLNAAIEAARAGEAGRGFSVVASEVNNLSNMTKDGMQSIHDILEKADASSTKVTGSIDQSIDVFNAGKETFEEIHGVFNAIAQDTQQVTNSIDEVMKDVETINNLQATNDKNANLIMKSSQEISAATTDVAAVTEESLAQTVETMENSQKLNEIISDLLRIVSRYKTTVVPNTKRKNDKHFRIAFFTLDDSDFWTKIQQGAFYAKTELADMNTTIDMHIIKPGDNFQSDYMQQMKEAIDEHVDGIINVGFLDFCEQYFVKAAEMRIPVFIYNYDLNNKQLRQAQFSPNAYDSGQIIAKRLVKDMNHKGNICIVSGEKVHTLYNERIKGFMNVFEKEKKMKITCTKYCHDKPEKMYDVVAELKNEKIESIYVASGFLTQAAQSVVENGMKDKVQIYGFDYSQSIFEFIDQGVISLVVGQYPFGQGHDPIVWMYNMLASGDILPGENMWSRLELVDKKNVGNLM